MEKSQFDEARLFFVNQVEELIQQNKFQEALILVEKKLLKMPSDIDGIALVIQALIKMDMIEESRNLLNELEISIKKMLNIYLQSFDAYREKRLDQDAALIYQKLLSINPHAKDSEEFKKIALVSDNNNQIEEIADSDNNSPGPDFYTMTLADLYIKQGHAKMAAEILREIIIKEPDNTQAREKLEAMEALKTPELFDNSDKINSLINTLKCWLDNLNKLKNNAN